MDRHLRCGICLKTFSHYSSLVRHTKQCTDSPVVSVRQKSCHGCTRAKTKCDLLRPKCSRCTLRGTTCEYIVPTRLKARRKRPSSQHHEGASASTQNLVYLNTIATAAPCLGIDNQLEASCFNGPFTTDMSLGDYTTLCDTPDNLPSLSMSDNVFSDAMLEQVCSGTSEALFSNTGYISDSSGWDFKLGHSNINHEDGWLWKPGSTVTPPPLVKHSMENLLRVMKTWPKMLAKGFQVPPMFHYTHTSPGHIRQPIADCIILAKAWVHQPEGGSGALQQTVRQAIFTLFKKHRSMDESYLLSTIQAMVIYTIMLMFPGPNQSAVCLVDPAIFLCLQRVVSYVAATGLIATEERDNMLPTWDCWVHVTAKRRAVLSLYLLHWSYSVYHGLESFECSQLSFMPAPAAKFLWQTKDANEWKNLYSMWLAQWEFSPYTMREFTTIEAGTALDERTETWLEDTDELGILFFTIVNATHRGEPRFDYGGGISAIIPE